MKRIIKFISDTSPGGAQDQNAAVQWLIKRCAVFSGNVWTAFRVVPGPLAVIWLFNYSPLAGLVAFVSLALTDFIDGKVARERGEASQGGAFWDATVDKIFVIPCFYYLGLMREPLLNPTLFWLMAVAETLGRLLIYLVRKWRRQPLNFEAKWYGKQKFNLQVVLVILLFVYYLIPIISWWTLLHTVLLVVLLNVLLLVTTIFAWVSVASHIWNLPEPRFKKLGKAP